MLRMFHIKWIVFWPALWGWLAWTQGRCPCEWIPIFHKCVWYPLCSCGSSIVPTVQLQLTFSAGSSFLGSTVTIKIVFADYSTHRAPEIGKDRPKTHGPANRATYTSHQVSAYIEYSRAPSAQHKETPRQPDVLSQCKKQLGTTLFSQTRCLHGTLHSRVTFTQIATNGWQFRAKQPSRVHSRITVVPNYENICSSSPSLEQSNCKRTTYFNLWTCQTSELLHEASRFLRKPLFAPQNTTRSGHHSKQNF